MAARLSKVLGLAFEVHERPTKGDLRFQPRGRARGSARYGRHALAFAALLIAVTLAGCTGALFNPVAGPSLRAVEPSASHRYLRFETADDVELEGWFLRAEEPLGTVVFADGAENVRHHIDTVEWLTNAGYNVVLFNYRGYGGSEGLPKLAGFHRDLRGAIRVAQRHHGLPRERLVLFGQSLGGSIATVVMSRMAPQARPGAMVVDSAPMDYRRVVRETLRESWVTWPFHVPLSWLVTDSFEASEAAADLPHIPKLWIVNPDDDTVELHHTKTLYRLAPEPSALWRIRGREHIATLDPPAARQAFARWLERAVLQRRAQPAPRTRQHAADASAHGVGEMVSHRVPAP